MYASIQERKRSTGLRGIYTSQGDATGKPFLILHGVVVFTAAFPVRKKV